MRKQPQPKAADLAKVADSMASLCKVMARFVVVLGAKLETLDRLEQALQRAELERAQQDGLDVRLN